jgi:hypothetical protein
MIYPAAPGIWVCQHVVPPIAGLMVWRWEGLMRDFGVEWKPLHSPNGAEVEKYTPCRGRYRAASMRLLIEVVWINR